MGRDVLVTGLRLLTRTGRLVEGADVAVRTANEEKLGRLILIIKNTFPGGFFYQL